MNWVTIFVLLAIGGIVWAMISRAKNRKTIVDDRGPISERVDEAKHRAAVEEAEKKARREKEIEEAKERGRHKP